MSLSREDIDRYRDVAAKLTGNPVPEPETFEPMAVRDATKKLLAETAADRAVHADLATTNPGGFLQHTEKLQPEGGKAWGGDFDDKGWIYQERPFPAVYDTLPPGELKRPEPALERVWADTENRLLRVDFGDDSHHAIYLPAGATRTEFAQILIKLGQQILAHDAYHNRDRA